MNSFAGVSPISSYVSAEKWLIWLDGDKYSGGDGMGCELRQSIAEPVEIEGYFRVSLAACAKQKLMAIIFL